MPSYLVTGASRGLGYAFIQILAANSLNTVIGLVRDKQATEARLAKDAITNVHILEGDLTDMQSLKLAAEKTEQILGSQGIDVFINNAGYISSTTNLMSLSDYEKNLVEVYQDTQKSIDINLFGTMNAVFAFLPLVRKGQLRKVVAISSGMGDIDLINEAKLPNAVPYSVSKAALSTLFAKLDAAYEEEGLLFISLDPSWINNGVDPATLSPEDLARLQAISKKFLKYATPGFAPLTPVESATRCLTAIDRSSLAAGSGGTFLSSNGTKRWM